MMFNHFFEIRKNLLKNPQEITSLVGLFDDPYGIRTRVTAVKGRCLNRLTKGPRIIFLSS